MTKKYSCEVPEGLLDGYRTIFVDRYCTHDCFSGYGGCGSHNDEPPIINVKKLIDAVAKALHSNIDTKIFLYTPNFFDPCSGIDHLTILQEIAEKNLQPYLRIEATVNSLIRKSPDFYKSLYNYGVREIWMGVESASDELRNKYGKPTFSNYDLEMITGLMQRQGIICCWYLVVGIDDTDDSIEMTVDLVKKLAPDQIYLHPTIPYVDGENNVNWKILREKWENNTFKVDEHRAILLNLPQTINDK